MKSQQKNLDEKVKGVSMLQIRIREQNGLNFLSKELQKLRPNISNPSVLMSLDQASINLTVIRKDFQLYLVTANPLDTSWEEIDSDSILDRELDPVSDQHLIPDSRDFLTAGLKFNF